MGGERPLRSRCTPSTRTPRGIPIVADPLRAFLASAFPTPAADPTPAISADRIKADVAYLASDRLEGPRPRHPRRGTHHRVPRGRVQEGRPQAGRRTRHVLPARPARPRRHQPEVHAPGDEGRRPRSTSPASEDFSGTSQTQTELEEFDAEAVFVGHGITAPEFGWDDYKGVDVKGKVVVLFTNEPPSDDPKFFGGTALTYYGRWTFKFEEAARRGAKACFIIHTTGDGRLPVLRRPAARRRPAQARPRQAGARLRRLALPRGGREAPGPGRPHGGRGAEGGRHEGVQAVLARRQPEGPHPDPRREDRQQQRRRHGRGQRPGAEVGGRRLHGPLGPPRRRPGASSATRSTTARRTTPPAAPCCSNSPARGRPSRRSRSGRPSSSPSPRRRRGCSARSTTPRTRSSRWARRRSTSTST